MTKRVSTIFRRMPVFLHETVFFDLQAILEEAFALLSVWDVWKTAFFWRLNTLKQKNWREGGVNVKESESATNNKCSFFRHCYFYSRKEESNCTLNKKATSGGDDNNQKYFKVSWNIVTFETRHGMANNLKSEVEKKPRRPFRKDCMIIRLSPRTNYD